MEQREIRPERRRGEVAEGTLACPDCDAPVAPPGGRAPLAAPVACPFCGTSGLLRDFLSLTAPTRPARVIVTVRQPSLRAPT